MLAEQTPSTGNGTGLPADSAGTAVIAVAIGFLALGLVIAIGRRFLGGRRDSADTFVRSWLGLALNAGLLLACVATLGTDDTTLRSTLFGGLIAGAGAASAFYFASAGSDQARKDILAASLPAVLAPDLTAKSPEEAEAAIAKLPLALEFDGLVAGSRQTVASQKPEPRSVLRSGDPITATLTVPSG